jgi:hypothetical protein
MNRLLSREDMSRTLAIYGAFAVSGKIMAGDDRATLAHLYRLRAKLRDERGYAIARVIRNLEALVASEGNADA